MKTLAELLAPFRVPVVGTVVHGGQTDLYLACGHSATIYCTLSPQQTWICEECLADLRAFDCGCVLNVRTGHIGRCGRHAVGTAHHDEVERLGCGCVANRHTGELVQCQQHTTAEALG